MATFNTKLINQLEKDVIKAVGFSLTKNNKVITSATLKSIRAESSVTANSLEVSGIGGEGLPYIIAGKKAGTKYPVDFVNGKFKLKPKLAAWKKAVGFGGSDFQLARTIAENPRPGVDIATDAINWLEDNTLPKVFKDFGNLLISEIKNLSNE